MARSEHRSISRLVFVKDAHFQPMLYSVVAEVLADNIEHHCPHSMVRSYADDTAIVSEDIWREGPVLAKLSAEF